MKCILVPNIVYELVIADATGQVKSQFFASSLPLKSRASALNQFLELTLTEDLKTEELYLTVFCRYIPTGERLELLNTSTFEKPGENLKALEQEVYWYQKEKIATHLGIYDHNKKHQIIILWPRVTNAHIYKTPTTSIVLAHQYWCFLRRKKQILRVA